MIIYYKLQIMEARVFKLGKVFNKNIIITMLLFGCLSFEDIKLLLADVSRVSRLLLIHNIDLIGNLS